MQVYLGAARGSYGTVQFYLRLYFLRRFTRKIKLELLFSCFPWQSKEKLLKLFKSY